MGFFANNRHVDTYAVIGLGRFGTAVAETLAEYGLDLIVVDKDEDRVRDMRRLTENAYVVNTIDQKVLEEIGVADCTVAIVCIGSAMDVNILTTLYCINMKVPRVIAKANSLDQGQILEKLGAEVVYPERDMGFRLGNQLANKKVVDYFSVAGNIDVAQLHIPKSFVGQKLIDLQLRQKYGISIIAIMTEGTTIEDIDPNYVFKEGDNIIIIGSADNILRFEDETMDE
ncbi:MAG: TrkA family potassium uptake protein [Ileibacterium sp.]|nr:TrkA family potassium uptake protein [Ileibacterium sp.]